MRDAILVVVGDCPARSYWSAAGRGDDHGNDRNGDCALAHVRSRWMMDACSRHRDGFFTSTSALPET